MKQNSTNIRLSHEAHYALHALAALRKEPMSRTILFLVNREMAARERQIADKVNKAREERANKQAVSSYSNDVECHQQ